MRITWLGQAGLLFETGGLKIVVDPYLSDSVAKLQPQNRRRVPVDEKYLRIKPDVAVITHNHADHLDRETLCRYFTPSSKTLALAPLSAWNELRRFGGEGNNYVMFNDGTTWTEKGVSFRAVKAEHSDEYAVGVIISAENRNYYITGDTLYSEKVFDSLPEIPFYAVFLPINGRGNNMNAEDAALFARRVKAEYAVPVHFGMFDDIRAEAFKAANMTAPVLYSEIRFGKKF